MSKFDITIETTKGSNLKYRQDPESKVFEVRKALPLGMVFPYDFGFIPGTQGEDGDPIDAMLISEFASFAGSRMKCRIIGGLLAEQSNGSGGKKVRNDRFFFIPKDSVAFSHINNIEDLGKEHNEQLQDFFINYNKAENKLFEPLKWVDAASANSLLNKPISGKL